MKKIDFNIVLRDFINNLSGSLKVRLDYLKEGEDIVLYSLPGGKVIEMYMDGTQVISLPYEIAIKLKSQEVANAFLWEINSALSSFDIALPSANGSYTFIDLEIKEPFLNDRDDHGYYVYLLDVVARLEIEREEK